MGSSSSIQCYRACSFLDRTAEKQMKWMTERRKDGETWHAKGQHLVPKATKHNQEQSHLSNNTTVDKCNDDICYVTYTQAQARVRRTVNLATKTCSCMQWQQHEMPCLHAIAAARDAGRLDDMAAWYAHAFNPVYRVATYRQAYAGKCVVLPQKETLTLRQDAKPANFVKQAGRPKKKRIRSRGEAAQMGQLPIKRTKCSVCGVVGHNRATCTRKQW